MKAANPPLRNTNRGNGGLAEEEEEKSSDMDAGDRQATKLEKSEDYIDVLFSLCASSYATTFIDNVLCVEQ